MALIGGLLSKDAQAGMTVPAPEGLHSLRIHSERVPAVDPQIPSEGRTTGSDRNRKRVLREDLKRKSITLRQRKE